MAIGPVTSAAVFGRTFPPPQGLLLRRTAHICATLVSFTMASTFSWKLREGLQARHPLSKMNFALHQMG